MASEGFLSGCTRWSSKSPRGWSPRMVRWLCLLDVHEVRGTWGMPCMAIRAPARFPVTAWCLPMAAYAMVLLLAVPMLNRELLLGEGVAFKDDMHVDLAACRWPAGL